MPWTLRQDTNRLCLILDQPEPPFAAGSCILKRVQNSRRKYTRELKRLICFVAPSLGFHPMDSSSHVEQQVLVDVFFSDRVPWSSSLLRFSRLDALHEGKGRIQALLLPNPRYKQPIYCPTTPDWSSLAPLNPFDRQLLGRRATVYGINPA